MPFVSEIDGATQRSYRKDKVPNEKFRFVTATSGQRFTAEFGTSPDTAINAGIGTITLPFEYFVGRKQVQVYRITPATATRETVINETDYLQAIADGDVATGLGASGYVFREITKNTVEVENLAGAITTEIFEVYIPHTSVPGANENRIVVNDQPDDVAVQLKGNGDGIEMVAPGGIVYILTVGDGGVLNVRQKL